MRQFPVLAAALALGGLVGCAGGGIEGTLVNGMTGEPIAGVGILAKAKDQVRMTCQTFKATTDESGKWKIPEACTGDSTYALLTDSEELWLPTEPTVPKGGAQAPVALEAWPAPRTSGVYVLSNGKLESLRTVADLKHETIQGTDVKVKYPSQIPPKVARVGPGDQLVLTGKDYVGKVDFVPLLESGPRKFSDGMIEVKMDSYWYLGTRFHSDTEFEKVTAAPAAEKVITKEGEKHAAQFIPADALPKGRYVLKRAKDKRVFMFDVEGSLDAGMDIAADDAG